MLVVTAAEMAEIDRRSVAAGIPIGQLMKAAGEAVAAFCLQQYPEAGRVLVLCGKGNNGGDGLVAARCLAAHGVAVRVLLAVPQGDLAGDAAEALKRLVEATAPDSPSSPDGPDLEELPADTSAADLARLFSEADLVVDAVLGTGFTPPLRGPAKLLQQALTQVAVPVVAVDLPSGWVADSEQEDNPDAFRADAVVTFTAPKLAHVFGHLTSATFGPVVVAAIGSPADTVASGLNLTWAGAAKVLTERPRPVNSNKGRFGHVLVVGGSYGTAGAPSMAALACMRAGAGLVTAAVPRELVSLVGGIAPELMVRGLVQGDDGSATLANLEPAALQALLEGIKVVALGPGLSTRGEASEFARQMVARALDRQGKPIPMVVDADALNAFQGQAQLLDGRGRTLVLTPHPGEMARLAGMSVAEVEADRIGLARDFATTHQLTLVLKGWRTLVAHPDGRVAVNTTGNPALAKGGSGDILTGIVAAMLAQYPDDVATAVEAAVYLHGLAADLAVSSPPADEKTVLATDVIGHLSAAFQARIGEPAWLCGLNLRRPEAARLG